MTEEIKEIIDYLIDEECTRRIKCITIEESKQLLDYITNLQQLYENALKVNQNTEKYRTELETKCVILQQENESLKQILHNITINGVEEENTTVLDLINENQKLKECYCNRTDCSGRLKDSKKYDSVYQEKEDYKSRCEKAIEYINFVINHYKEQLETPIEYTYFDSDVNRKGYILSIIAYLQTTLDTLIGSDENE